MISKILDLIKFGILFHKRVLFENYHIMLILSYKKEKEASLVYKLKLSGLSINGINRNISLYSAVIYKFFANNYNPIHDLGEVKKCKF